MTESLDGAEQRATRAWQRRILPLMIVMLVVGGLLFSAVSIVEFRRLEAGIARDAARVDVAAILKPSPGETLAQSQAKQFTVRAFGPGSWASSRA